MTNINDNEPTPDEEPDELIMVACMHCGCELDPEWGEYYSQFPIGSRWRQGYLNRDSIPSEPVFCWDCCSSCDDCGEPTLNDYLHTVGVDGSRTVCSYCCEDYVECADCSDMRHSEDSRYLDADDCYVCLDCDNSTRSSSRTIHSYSYVPSPKLFWFTPTPNETVSVHMGELSYGYLYGTPLKFDGLLALPDIDTLHHSRIRPHYHTDDLYMGFELETNRGNCIDINGAARYLLSAMKRPKTQHGDEYNSDESYLYLKEDGSVTGFEIVSHPATLEAHKLRIPRDALTSLARDHGMTGWSGEGAGLHVHVNKRAFSHSHLHKFQLFHYRNSTWLKRFAGRDSGRWASFDQTRDHNGDNVKLSSLAKGQYERTYLNRYHALNFCPTNTVELRYFRSSLLPDTLIAVLEMVHAMWLFTGERNSSDYRDNGFAWSHFRSWVQDKDYEFLVPVMDKRGV